MDRIRTIIERARQVPEFAQRIAPPSTFEGLIAVTDRRPSFAIRPDDRKWMEGPFRLAGGFSAASGGEAVSLTGSAARSVDGRIEVAYGTGSTWKARLHIERVQPVLVPKGVVGGDGLTVQDWGDLLRSLELRATISGESYRWPIGDYIYDPVRQSQVTQTVAADAEFLQCEAPQAGSWYELPEGAIQIDAEVDTLELYAETTTTDAFGILLRWDGLIAPNSARREEDELSGLCGGPGRLPVGLRSLYAASIRRVRGG